MSKIPQVGDLYVALDGNDAWSGIYPEPTPDGTDGPLATIEHARDIVRARKEKGELVGALTVWLRGGVYALKQPLSFGPEDSAPVTYAAYEGEEVVLDGGERIGGWREEEANGVRVWRADLPQVAAGKWCFRQLWVNGERRPRARFPKDGFYWMADVPGINMDAQLFDGTDTFVCEPGDIQAWRNISDIDVVAIHYWIEERMPIASFDAATNTVVSSRRSMFALKDDVRKKYAKYYVENVFEALSEPGEWYLDRATGALYYVPKPGETLETVEVYAPRMDRLLNLQGDAAKGHFVEFLRFEGLAFQHADWYQETGLGARWGLKGVEFAASAQGAVDAPAALHLEGARYCAIEDCEVSRVGMYAIELLAGCRGVRVVGNAIHDMGAGGLKLDGATAEGLPVLRTGNNQVTDNHIYDGGHVFPSACGILAVHTFGNELSHNHIHDLFYSGISCGWVWGYGDSVSKDNHIEKNHIHDLGKRLLSDMGGVYTLGVQPGTTIRGNLIHDVEKWNYGGWAIYPDEGSSHIIIENNICYRTSSQPFHQHYGRENVIRNNIWAFGAEGQVRHGRGESHRAFTFERNIVITDGQPLFVGGGRAFLEECKFFSDLNLFWDVSGAELFSANSKYDADAVIQHERIFALDAWRSLGQDIHSIIADPQCADPKGDDFTLAADSPAFALGFVPIDLSDVGPRPVERRTDEVERVDYATSTQ